MLDTVIRTLQEDTTSHSMTYDISHLRLAQLAVGFGDFLECGASWNKHEGCHVELDDDS